MAVYARTIRGTRTAGIEQAGPGHRHSFVLEPGRWSEHDPFLVLMEDWFRRGSFDVHPHRGIETVTYVMEGRLEHYDSKTGEAETLGPDDAQWMTAGRGVIHKEDPAVGETVHSLQLWVNLPSASKMIEPHYQNLRSADMPVREEPGATVRIFSGSSGGIAAPTRNIVPVTMAEFRLEPGASIKQDLPGSYNGFIFVLEGEGEFGADRTKATARQVLFLGGADGHADSEIEIAAPNGPLKALLYAGEPVREHVVARGPFVMNTMEEIVQAYEDYRDGKFLG